MNRKELSGNMAFYFWVGVIIIVTILIIARNV